MKQIAIIGSRPAGIEAAQTAAALGAQVTMISTSPSELTTLTARCLPA